jgi:short subunit fatty acids transporter
MNNFTLLGGLGEHKTPIHFMTLINNINKNNGVLLQFPIPNGHLSKLKINLGNKVGWGLCMEIPLT